MGMGIYFDVVFPYRWGGITPVMEQSKRKYRLNHQTNHMAMKTKTRSSLISYQPAGQFEETRFEKIHNVIFDTSQQGSIEVAKEISNLIREKASKGQNCVLGLATGSSPIKVYEELVRIHREEG